MQSGLALAHPDHNAGERQHGNHQSHQRHQHPSWKTKYPPRMQRKLQLHEDVGCTAPPRQIVAQEATIRPIEIHIGYFHAAAAMIRPGMEKRDTVETQASGIKNTRRWALPVARPPFLMRLLQDLLISDGGRYGLV